MNETIKDLRIICAAAGIYFAASPKNIPPTRYRFFTEPVNYNAGTPANTLHTAQNIHEAISYARGYLHGATARK